MAVDDQGETQFGDLLEDTSAVSPEQSVMTLLRSEELDGLIDRLEPRTASIIKMRYGIDDGRERTLRFAASVDGSGGSGSSAVEIAVATSASTARIWMAGSLAW